MFLPVLHDRMVVSRRPWATFTILGLCVAVFLATHGSDGRRESERLFGEAVAYHLAHPETRPDERLLSPELAAELRLALPVARRDVGVSIADGDPQAELDRRTEAWLAAVERDPAWRWGLVPRQRRPETFVSHQFLHGGWLHLIGNLFLFLLVAPLVEDEIGSWRFTLLYLGLGAFAGFAYLLHYPHLFRPLVGASGAISAVLGLFVVFFARMKLKYLLWIGVPLGTFEAPAWAMLPLWFLFQVYLGFESDQATAADAGGVAYWAHAWGFAGGAAVGFGLRRGRPTPTATLVAPDPLAEARKLLAAGRREEAWSKLLREVRSRPERSDAIHELWNLARMLGRRADAAFAFARLVQREARGGDALRALEMWEELRTARRSPHVEPALSLAVVEALEREELRRDERESILLDAIETASAETPTETLAALARTVAASSGPAREAWRELGRRIDLSARLAASPPQTPK